MSQFQLSGFALIAGAAGGIGLEVAYTFAEAGARGLVLADVDYEGAARACEKARTLASSPEFRALAVKLDVADAQSVQETVDRTACEFGRIDYCVNCVGVDVESFVPADQVSEEDYDRVLDVNTKGVFLLTKAVARVMKAQEPRQVEFPRHGTRDIGRGAIVTISSILSLIAMPDRAHYVTSKHAVLGLVRSVANDCKSTGIRVNMVSPSWVRTPMHEEDIRRNPGTATVVAKATSAGRPLEPDEVASACLYLCSPSAVYVHGANFVMDSGASVGPTILFL